MKVQGDEEDEIRQYVICYLLFVICYLLFVIRYSLFGIWEPSFEFLVPKNELPN